MSNPLYSILGSGQFGPVQMVQEFQKFLQEMKGKDPNQEISRLLQSGQISQEQLNQAQQMAQQIKSAIGNFR